MTEETPDMASGRIAIGIDVGGSGIKAAVVDVEAGRFRSERIRVGDAQPVDARGRARLGRRGSSSGSPSRAGSVTRRRSASGCPA